MGANYIPAVTRNPNLSQPKNMRLPPNRRTYACHRTEEPTPATEQDPAWKNSIKFTERVPILKKYSKYSLIILKF